MTQNAGSDLAYASELLANNKLVAIPTETVYGIAANALSPIAVAKIFEIKERPSFDPLIVHVASIDDFSKYGKNISKWVYKIAEKFCPGPITFILQKKNIIPDIVTSGLPTVGIRIPDHPMTLGLLKITNFPLAAPSANKFGKISPTNANHVSRQFGKNLDYIINGGSTKVGIESTIIKIADNTLFLLRHGGISAEELSDFTKLKIVDSTQNNHLPQAPGQLLNHYAPDTKLIICRKQDIKTEMLNRKAAFLGFKSFIDELPHNQQYILSETGDLREAASKLFSTLHKIDELDYKLIIAEEFPNEGLGIAINDRLKRASASFND